MNNEPLRQRTVQTAVDVMASTLLLAQGCQRSDLQLLKATLNARLGARGVVPAAAAS